MHLVIGLLAIAAALGILLFVFHSKLSAEIKAGQTAVINEFQKVHGALKKVKSKL